MISHKIYIHDIDKFKLKFNLGNFCASENITITFLFTSQNNELNLHEATLIWQYF